jgi:NADH dehydrogenase
MPHRIVVVGAGFAGMYSALSARRLISQNERDDDIEVVVIAPEPRLAVRPRLYEANPASMTAPLEKLFKATGVKFVQGLVTTIDSTARHVTVEGCGAESKSTLSYDRLILAAGSRLRIPNVDGLRDHAFNVDQVHSAAALDKHLHGLADAPESAARNTVVVCGGGFTGIELAAEIPARLRAILGQDATCRAIIVERNPEIGPGLGSGPRPAILAALREHGVEMKLGVAVTSVDADGIVTSTGERIAAKTVVWTGGMAATELTQQVPANKDTLGRLLVDEHLRVPGFEDIFATGDAACAATDSIGNTAMMSCQHAGMLGRSSGHNAAADLLQVANRPYSQPGYVTCLDLGPNGAVVTYGWDREVAFTGSQAKQIKQFINTTLIYPPPANADEAFSMASPDYEFPAFEPREPVAAQA